MSEVRPKRPARAKPDPSAAAAFALARAIEGATARLGPAADAIVGFEKRLDKLCLWLKRRGPWILACAPLVVTAINGASPQASNLLAAILRRFLH